MKNLVINNQVFPCVSQSELPTTDLNGYEDHYYMAFHHAHIMSQSLGIPCPDIGIVDQLCTLHPDTGYLSAEFGRTFNFTDASGNPHNLVILSLNVDDGLQIIGTLAHEMRHLWQDQQHANINKKPYASPTESYLDPAEIDADGYGIAYISTAPEMDIHKAGRLLCPYEYANNKQAYKLRIRSALKFSVKRYLKKLWR